MRCSSLAIYLEQVFLGKPISVEIPSVSAVGPHEATWYDLWVNWLGLSGPSLFSLGLWLMAQYQVGNFIYNPHREIEIRDANRDFF